jgi:peptide/nickel transport system substrate-binding protein
MQRKFLILFTVLISTILVLSTIISCGGETDTGGTQGKETVKPELKNPGTFIYATIGAWDSLDPAYAYDSSSMEVLQAVYEPLISNWNTTDTSHF